MEPAQEPRAETPDRAAAGDSVVDRFLDDLLPEELDWRRLVRSYPLPAVALAAVGGFFLGQRHGEELLSAFRAFVDREVERNVQTFLGEAPDDE